MKSYNRIAMGLVLASTLALSGCWMVRGDHGRDGRRQHDSTYHHNDRHDGRDQRDQRDQRD